MENPLLNSKNFGVIILCPDCNYAGLRTTVSSLQSEFPNLNHVAVVGRDAQTENVKSLVKYCRVYTGGKTITSLIDEGMKHLTDAWRLIVISGSLVRYRIIKKYKLFINNERDILYPVIDSKYIWDEASINGILMHQDTYNEVGEFGDDLADLKEAKLMWGARAVELKYHFKAIIGARL